MLNNLRIAVLESHALRRLFAASRWIFGPAAVIFLIIAGVRARGAFHAIAVGSHLASLTVTVLLWASLSLLGPVFTWLALRGTSAIIPYETALKIYLGRLPAKYLPGGVWQTVSRMIDLHRIGVDRSQLSALVMLENLVPLAVALTLGGACTFVIGASRLPALIAMMGGLTILVSVPVLLRHRLLLYKSRFPLRIYFLAVLTSVAFWIIAATAFTYYWYSFPSAHVDVSPLQVSGSYLLAWSAGFVSVFSPQGIGVFESVISLLLKGTLSFGEVAVLAVGFRVATLVADLLAYAIFLMVRYGRRILRPNRE
ncbi:hypothetical protein [Rhodanobacter sp. L36]|uniref:hypothetical protein n=1 Tax=Rhodanobacter sp. L36 TaxID=1747221 RepID=UPI00131A978B|nr:hypothetical protein [Rhodanobacter sp. L36]